MHTIKYSDFRRQLKVGDVIGCRGSGFVSRAIRKIKGGKWDWSHVSIIIRDAHNEGTGRVEVLEAIMDKGMQRNYLSKAYEKDHGKLFLLHMNCDKAQRAQIMELGAQIMEKETKYDLKSIWRALFAPVLMDVKKFICSESAWYLLTKSGRLLMRLDDKKREIAPVPGDFPTWSGVDPIEIDMGK